MKKIRAGVVVFTLVTVLMFSLSWFSAKRNLAGFAAKVQPGTALDVTRSEARQRGLKYVVSSYRKEDGLFHDLVTSSGVMGGAVCEIQHDGRLVVKVIRQFHD